MMGVHSGQVRVRERQEPRGRAGASAIVAGRRVVSFVYAPDRDANPSVVPEYSGDIRGVDKGGICEDMR